uniref:Uncharacterized protein n=1 Tax=viral metagenome TaxID=1070528 RepID=A0A6C0AFD9_9ZZZZ
MFVLKFEWFKKKLGKLKWDGVVNNFLKNSYGIKSKKIFC